MCTPPSSYAIDCEGEQCIMMDATETTEHWLEDDIDADSLGLALQRILIIRSTVA